MKGRVVWAIAALLMLAAAWFLPVKPWLGAALTWAASHREPAALVFIALYVLATVCLIPGLILTLAGGAIFGLARGVALVSAGSLLGASAAFFIGRTFARKWTQQRIAAWPRFRALDGALGERGFWIVLLTRLSPLFPFNLLNYAYGVTAVRPRDYIAASWLGMLPATVLYVYAGSAAANLAQALSGRVRTGKSATVLLVVGLAATVAVTALVTRVARRRLEHETPHERGSHERG
ncbi:MAG: TVP38/TMEM64 family protein [Gammaproteobacteria bacterium]|nr:MAG: TVP38/TMEM64 family protein [Gammaproteobacteria bacterium]